MKISCYLELFSITQGSGVAPFTPASLSGLQLWLRSDLGVTLNSGTVSQWSDQSGNGNNFTQATTAKQPVYNAAALNGQPTLSFSSANTTSLIAPYSATLQPTNITVAIVWRWTIPANGTFAGIIMHQTSSSWNDGWGIGNGPLATVGQTEFFATDYNAHNVHATYNNTTWRLSVGTFDGTTINFLRDNVSEGTASFASNLFYTSNAQTVIGAYTIGGGAGAVAASADIDVAEIAIYNRALTSTELGQLHTYSQTRYATP